MVVFTDMKMTRNNAIISNIVILTMTSSVLTKFEGGKVKNILASSGF